MPKNKVKKNPYILYCQEQRQLHPDLSNLTLPELVEACSERWESLDPVEKENYVQSAKNSSFSSVTSGSLRGQFDSFGRSILALEQGRRLEEYNKTIMLEDISVRTANKKKAKSMRFHIMDVAVWTPTTSEFEIPAEIGLIELSIEEGIMEVFHQLVDPQEPPIGDRGDWKAHSDKYHKIWLDNEELCDDYEQILDNICNLLEAKPDEKVAGEGISLHNFEDISSCIEQNKERKKKSSKFLPIYVMPANAGNCEKAMNWLQKQAQKNCDFRFYSLPNFFMKMMESPVDSEIVCKIPTENLAEANLEKEILLFTPGTSCNYHHAIECSECSVAKVIRYALVMTQFCCEIFDVELVEGCHIPWGHESANPSASFLETSMDITISGPSVPPSNSKTGLDAAMNSLTYHTDPFTHPLAELFDIQNNILSLEEVLSISEHAEHDVSISKSMSDIFESETSHSDYFTPETSFNQDFE